MHTIEIPDRDKTISLPEHWDECTPSQACFVLQDALDVVAGRQTMADFHTRVFAHLTGLEADAKYHYTQRVNPAMTEDVNATIVRLSEQLCAWPFRLNEDKFELNMDTVRNLLPTIKCGNNVLAGPADLLADLTFGEFRAALREMGEHIRMAKDPDESDDAGHYLDRFVAVLYRPLDASHNRVPFDPDNIAKHAFLVRFAPAWQKQTILLWFSYCVKYIQNEDILIDGITLNLSALFPNSTAGTATAKKGVGWAGLLYDVAKEGLFGDVEKTDKTGLFDVFVYLYKRHLDNKELERKYKSARK